MRDARLVPEFKVSDIARSLHFYTEVLGFSIRYQRAEGRFAYLEREGAELMLEESTGGRLLAGELEHPYGRGMHLQIEVSDVDALHDEVMAAGVVVQLPMEEKWYERVDDVAGNRQFAVQDPDGYVLRFFLDLGTRAR